MCADRARIRQRSFCFVPVLRACIAETARQRDFCHRRGQNYHPYTALLLTCSGILQIKYIIFLRKCKLFRDIKLFFCAHIEEKEKMLYNKQKKFFSRHFFLESFFCVSALAMKKQRMDPCVLTVYCKRHLQLESCRRVFACGKTSIAQIS